MPPLHLRPAKRTSERVRLEGSFGASFPGKGSRFMVQVAACRSTYRAFVIRLTLSNIPQEWSGISGSNRREQLGRMPCYHYINPACIYSVLYQENHKFIGWSRAWESNPLIRLCRAAHLPVCQLYVFFRLSSYMERLVEAHEIPLPLCFWIAKTFSQVPEL